MKSLKDKQETDMKQFLAQQKAEFRATKALYKRQLEENSGMNSAQKKTILEERKKELIAQQKTNEESRLKILKTASHQETIEFRQKALQERHSFEKGLLQEVRINFYTYNSLSERGWVSFVSDVMPQAVA